MTVQHRPHYWSENIPGDARQRGGQSPLWIDATGGETSP